MTDIEDLYPCVGICMPDPDTGYCVGCGRPPPASPEASTAEPAAPQSETPVPAPAQD